MAAARLTAPLAARTADWDVGIPAADEARRLTSESHDLTLEAAARSRTELRTTFEVA